MSKLQLIRVALLELSKCLADVSKDEKLTMDAANGFAMELEAAAKTLKEFTLDEIAPKAA